MSVSSQKKFRFLLDEGSSYILHEAYPKCWALLQDGVDRDMFEDIFWKDLAPDSKKEKVIDQMIDWYWHDFQEMPREN